MQFKVKSVHYMRRFSTAALHHSINPNNLNF